MALFCLIVVASLRRRSRKLQPKRIDHSRYKQASNRGIEVPSETSNARALSLAGLRSWFRDKRDVLCVLRLSVRTRSNKATQSYLGEAERVPATG